MIGQVALTAMAIPIGIEGASEAIRIVRIHAQFPNHEYVSARLEFDRPAGEGVMSAFEERRARMYARLEQQIAEEPDVVAVTFADRVPGASFQIGRTASVDIPSGAAAPSKLASRHRRSARVSSRPSAARSSPDAASIRATSVPLPER